MLCIHNFYVDDMLRSVASEEKGVVFFQVISRKFVKKVGSI